MQKQKWVQLLRTTGKKVIAGALGAAILLSSIPAAAANGAGEEEACNKITEKLQERMSQLTAEGKTDEEIPVYVWYQDIDQEEVEEQTEKATGTSRLDLDKMITVEENDESTDDLDLDMYLEKTEDQRQEVADLTEKFINTQRTLAKEAYQE